MRAPDMAPPKIKDAPRGTIHGSLFDGLVSFTVRAVPLPPAITDFLLTHPATISSLLSQRTDAQDDSDEAREERQTAEGAAETRVLSATEFWKELEGICKKVGGEWVGAADRVWCFGPKRMGANLLLDPVGKSSLRCAHSQSQSRCFSRKVKG